jgi:CRISPR/Cas system Type II protein with McrA/HNH and RuvC-like nuclease domain
MAGHWALYGTVAIRRGFCTHCKMWALVLDGKIQCCDRLFGEDTKRTKRISEPGQARSKPKPETQLRILAEQGSVCLYCGRSFGSWVQRRNKPLQLRLEWDHICPWKYSQDNRQTNFVAACHLCNAFKSDRVFSSIEDVRDHVAQKWADMETAPAKLPKLPKRFLAEKIVAKSVLR